MKHPIFAILFVLLLAVPSSAQTPTYKLQWDQIEPLATVQTYSYTLKVDAAPAVSLTATCVATGTGTRCTAPLAPLPAGASHTLILTGFNGLGSASSDPLTGSPPSKASGMTITVTITIP